MKIEYIPHGICARRILLEVENDTIQSAKVLGGCDGNAKGIAELVRGMKVDDVIRKLEHIKCGSKSSSCPAQLAEALKSIRE